MQLHQALEASQQILLGLFVVVAELWVRAAQRYVSSGVNRFSLSTRDVSLSRYSRLHVSNNVVSK